MKKLLFLLFLITGFKIYGTHITGNEITYKNLGNNNYEVHLYVYWDCTGGFNPGSSQQITVEGCLGSQFITLDQSTTTPGDGIDVTKTCPGVVSNCSGGSVNGINMIEYIAVVAIPGNCNDWIFNWNSCCRGGNIINLTNGTSESTSISAFLDNSAAPNNSAYFADYQPLYTCVNQLNTFDMSALDDDGNELRYKIVSALGSGGNPVLYNAPYSGANPINGAQIDSLSGLLQVNANAQGAFVICIRVDELNNNGDTVGTIVRDFQLHATSCSNQGLTVQSGGLNGSNVSGNASFVNSFVVESCAGSTFSFTINLEDPDLMDSLTITNNISVNPNLAGTTMNIVYPNAGQYNVMDVTFNFSLPFSITIGNIYLVLHVTDNYCPFPAERVLIYTIKTNPTLYAGTDKLICFGEETTLNANNFGMSYSWYDISDNIITPGPEFSCNPCLSPVVTPSATTSYVIHSNGTANCFTADTITVTVAQNFGLSFSSGDTLYECAGNLANVSSVPSVPATYTYNWSPIQNLSQPLNANPGMNIQDLGTFIYTVSVTKSEGCNRIDSLVVISEGVPQIVMNQDTCLINSTPINMNLSLNCGHTLTNCTTNLPCSGMQSQFINIGTGNVNPNQLPTPFLGFWQDGKMQMLFLASELQALGVGQGLISSISLQITSKGSSLPYSSFNIKMGCTNIAQFDTLFTSNLTTTYYNPSYSSILGINTFNFPNPYKWDGASNLVIEICFDNNVYSGDDYVTKSNTSFTSCATMYTDGASGCTFTIPSQTYNSRPNISFGIASSVNPANYTYSWSPTFGVSDPAIANPTITPPSGTTTYYVTVTTLDSSCSRTDSVTFNVNPNNPQITAQPVGDTLCPWGTINLSCSVAGTGYNLQWYGNNVALTNGGNISGVTTNNLIINSAQATEEGWYKCEIIGSCSPFQYTDSVYVYVSGCVSINENKNVTQLKIYPNPAKDILNIVMEERKEINSELLVYNSLGQCVVKETIERKNEIEISTTHFATGVYHLVLRVGEEIISTKFVKE